MGELSRMLKERELLMKNFFNSLSIVHRKTATEIFDNLLNGRSREWIPIIISNIRNRSCLIAVGALHLPGEGGLINLLRKEGFTLTPLDIYTTK